MENAKSERAKLLQLTQLDSEKKGDNNFLDKIEIKFKNQQAIPKH